MTAPAASSAPNPVPDHAAVQRLARLALVQAGVDPGLAGPADAAPALQPLAAPSLPDKPAASRTTLLAPVLPEGGLMLVHGPRGVGRSHVLVGCAAALASGDWFLGWRARRAANVLFLSGAASSAMLRERLGAALQGMRRRDGSGERLRLLTPDQQEAALPMLDTAQGQARLVPLLADIEVVVIDDASALMPGMSRNSERSQWRFGDFLRRLRYAGRTVLVGQASGPAVRGRADRGALACLEAQADVVVGLQRPAGYVTSDGARFELHIERANHLPGSAREVREIRLASTSRQPLWTAARSLDLARQRFHALLADGMPAPDAARELGLSRITGWRWARKVAVAQAAAFPGRADSAGQPEAEEPQATDTTTGIAA